MTRQEFKNRFKELTGAEPVKTDFSSSEGFYHWYVDIKELKTFTAYDLKVLEIENFSFNLNTKKLAFYSTIKFID